LRIAGRDGIVEIRDRRCRLLGPDGQERDVTDLAPTRPMHVELLDALSGENPDLYSTNESLQTARVILHARDAADRQTWLACT